MLVKPLDSDQVKGDQDMIDCIKGHQGDTYEAQA